MATLAEIRAANPDASDDQVVAIYQAQQPDAPPATIADAIVEAALNPLSASGDGQSYTEHPLPDLIAADKYNNAKAAAGRGPLGGIRRAKLRPPSAL